MNTWSLQQLELLGEPNFDVQSGLECVESLTTLSPNDPELPAGVLQRLAPFFEAALLMQRAPSVNGDWWLTHLNWHGRSYTLSLQEQVRSSAIIPAHITPTQVQRAAAIPVLEKLNMKFLAGPDPAHVDAFLIKPTPALAYLFVSRVAAPWAEDHMREAHRLVNKAFIF